MNRVPNSRLFFLVFFVFFISLYVTGPLLSLHGIQPDLWVLLVLFYAFRVEWKRVVLFAFFIGLVRDFLSTRFFGLETFTLGFSAIVLGFALGKVERDDPLTTSVSAFLFSLLYEWMNCVGWAVTGGDYALLPGLLIRSFWAAVYTVAVFPAAFIVFQHMTEERRFSEGGSFRE